MKRYDLEEKGDGIYAHWAEMVECADGEWVKYESLQDAPIVAERQRQIAKGYNDAHDDAHKDGEIILSDWGARALIEAAINALQSGDLFAYKELLTQAAAQCVAEIWRLERADQEK